jgi:hypothetical protein
LIKSSAIPIQCSDEDIGRTAAILSCSIGSLPCSYLGIPLSIHKPTKAVLTPLIDKIANKLPGWKAPLLSKAGRLVVVKSVISATPIHQMLALNLPKWFFKAVDKRRRGFLWKGQEQANGGNCLVSWAKVQRPYMFGGLGVHDLERMSWALRIRWLWFMKTDPSKPWIGLPINIPKQAQAFFQMAITVNIGNGNSSKFWIDNWLQGKSVADLAPNLVLAVPKRVIQRRTVSQALSNRGWVADIKGALTVQVLIEFLKVWELVEGIVLHPDVPDHFSWKFSSSGQYSSKSAYNTMFTGSIKFPAWRRIWKTWAPANCKFFIWLAINNRCWTSDRLAKRGLPHQAACPLCDQDVETINHILVSCVFAREVWSLVLNRIIPAVRPPRIDSHFNSWWCRASATLPKDERKGFNSLVVLVVWELWKHRNACVFQGSRPAVQSVVQAVMAEGHLWCLAGAAALRGLVLRTDPPLVVNGVVTV